MSRATTDLPEDLAELRRFAAALAAEVHAKTLLIEKLKARTEASETSASSSTPKKPPVRAPLPIISRGRGGYWDDQKYEWYAGI